MPPVGDPSEQPRGPYRALGVENDASEAQIKRAYHKLALRYHPVRARERRRARTAILFLPCNFALPAFCRRRPQADDHHVHIYTPDPSRSQDKNPDAGERFNEIAAAYTLLSDPRKRQLYDQFGEQGVQMVDNISQQGLPDWILNPAVQRAGLGLMAFLAVNFAVLMPLFILLRADAETGWPWPVALVPVWLGDLLYGAAVGWRLVAAFKQSAGGDSAGGHLHLTLRHSLLAFGVYLLLVASQVLLVPPL